jgi:GNAT superfamily N-acetyltransferase
MENSVSPDIVEKWLKGWSLSRELPLPVKFKSGFKVDVGFEKQKTRYVFPELNNDFIQLSKNLDEPWVFLKVCSLPSQIKLAVSDKWIIQPQGFMMSCFHPMTIANVTLHNDYKLKLTTYNSTFVIEILTQKDELASIGRVVLVDDLAVYDRILTDDKHRRKGLATFLMKELEKIALSKGIFKNFLVSTEEGKTLYQSLGWELYSMYTSIVIFP